MRVAIIGTGKVGSAQARGFSIAGHEVVMGSRNPSAFAGSKSFKVVTQREAVDWGELVVLAVPHDVMMEVIDGIGADRFNDKIVIDVSNILGPGMEWAMGFTSSGAEEIAKALKGAKVVKAFNTVFSPFQDKGRIGNERLTLFVAADDAKAKAAVMEYGRALGFDPVDAGPLSSARLLEPMGIQIIKLAFSHGLGANIGYKLVKG